MCGIFGVVRPGGTTAQDGLHFVDLSDALRHRGPDGEGLIRTHNALLGMHRLSIMDVESGWQPFWSEDQQIGVLGNGEIYNAAVLRRALLDRGHTLHTRSDIEVVPHLYEEHGTELPLHLRGMFALAILDKRKRQILLIRDRMGEKPLSYINHEGALYFSSEQTPLIRTMGRNVHVEPPAVSEYLLHGFVPETHSIVRGVNKIPAGCQMTYSLDTGASTIHPYWSPIEHSASSDLSTRRLRELLEDAIAVTATSDVPIGVALSGGLDSSLVAAVLHSRGIPVSALSVGYPNQGTDESDDARRFAQHLGIPFHRTELAASDVGNKYAEVCRARDEPIADIAGPALSAVSQLAREQGVPVLMTGLGGDELFWGYEWVSRLAAWTFGEIQSSNGIPWPSLPPKGRQGQFDWLRNGLGVGSELKLRRFTKRHMQPGAFPFPLYEFQFGAAHIHRAIKSLGLPTPQPEFLLQASESAVAPSYGNEMLTTYLRVNGLTQLDRLSMHQSIESRVPLVDHPLLEAVVGSMWMTTPFLDPPKSALRQVARELLPPWILARPKKGFTPPVRQWLHAIWLTNDSVLTMDATKDALGVDGHRLQSAVKSFKRPSGRVDQVAFRLLTLELWLRGLMT